MTPVLVIFRFVGYGLLLLSLFDFVSAVIPPQFGNPAWQFRIAGEFVERSAVPLIGMLLVFYEADSARKKKERLVLRLLSWFSLLMGVAYLAMVVIFFITPPTLNQNSQAQVSAQFDPRITQLQQIQTQVGKADATQIENLMKSQRVTNTTPQAFKEKIIQEASAAEKNFKNQAEITNSNQRTSLFKSAIKWGLGALVTGVLFIRIWAGTAWARI